MKTLFWLGSLLLLANVVCLTSKAEASSNQTEFHHIESKDALCKNPQGNARKTPLAIKTGLICKKIIRVGFLSYLALSDTQTFAAVYGRRPSPVLSGSISSLSSGSELGEINPNTDGGYCHCSCDYSECYYDIKKAQEDYQDCFTSLGQREKSLHDTNVDHLAAEKALLKPTRFE